MRRGICVYSLLSRLNQVLRLIELRNGFVVDAKYDGRVGFGVNVICGLSERLVGCILVVI